MNFTAGINTPSEKTPDYVGDVKKLERKIESWKAKKWLKEQDELAPSIKTELHLDNDNYEKTQIGGVITMTLKLQILVLAVTLAYSMVTNYKPYLASVQSAVPRTGYK